MKGWKKVDMDFLAKRVERIEFANTLSDAADKGFQVHAPGRCLLYYKGDGLPLRPRLFAQGMFSMGELPTGWCLVLVDGNGVASVFTEWNCVLRAFGGTDEKTMG